MKVFSLGEKIRKLREKKGMSLKELAGDFVSKAQLSLVENNKRSPNIKLIEYLADKLDTNLEYLLETELQQAKKYCKLLLEEIKCQSILKNINRIIELYKDIVNYAKKYNLIKILGETDLIVGQTYLSIKDYEKALDYIESAILYFYESKDYKNLSKSFLKQGNIYYLKELYEVALNSYQKAISFYGNLEEGDLELKSDIYFDLAACYNNLKNHDLAISYANEVCQIDKKLKDKERYVKSLIKSSSTLIRTNKFEKAKEVLLEANYILENKKQNITKAYVENNLGLIYLETKQYDKAYEHLSEAKKLKVNYNSDELPSTLFELHKYYLSIFKEEKAVEVLEEGLKYSTDKGLKNYIIEGLNLYVDYYIKSEEYKNALQRLSNLIKLLESVQRKNDLLDAYLKKGNILIKMRKENEALQAFNKGYKLNCLLRKEGPI